MLIRTRLWLLLASTLAAVGLAGVSSMSADRQTIENAVQLHKADHQELLETYLRLFANGREIWLFDNTFWDDAVTFVQGEGADVAWADANWGDALSTLDADGMMVFDKTGALLYQKAEGSLPLAVEAIPATALLGNEPVHHYFLQTGSDIVEVQTATIHPSGDRAHAGPQAGVVVLLTRWDAEALAELGALLHAEVAVVAPGTAEIAPQGSLVSVEVPLRDLTGAPGGGDPRDESNSSAGGALQSTRQRHPDHPAFAGDCGADHRVRAASLGVRAHLSAISGAAASRCLPVGPAARAVG